MTNTSETHEGRDQLRRLEDYRGIITDKEICDIYRRASTLYGKHVVNINSTYQGGGVAEIISAMVPLMNDLGIDTGWRILHGNADFFTITKTFHNALHGEEINFTEMKKDLYVKANEDFSNFSHIDHDCVIIHDPQPLPLIRYYRKKQPWIWRCHIDLTNPNKEVWDYLKTFLLRYDKMVVSNEAYIQRDLPLEQRIIPPAIDPLAPKNMTLPPEVVEKYLEKFGVSTDKPIITQISRFDKWKDPEGVIQVFEEVRKEVDCRLILCGSMAADDPEGQLIFQRIAEKVSKLTKNGDIILITSENNILVNALQQVSDVIIQKSLREGFGLTVTEALWKARPVVASDVGGISLQIEDGESGYLVRPDNIRGFADHIIEVLQDPGLGKKLGENGKETVREKYLITRLLGDYLDCLNETIVYH